MSAATEGALAILFMIATLCMVGGGEPDEAQRAANAVAALESPLP